MKHLTLIFTLLSLTTFTYSYDYGGGNGGSDIEFELKKITLQIAEFINSNEGRNQFRLLNHEMLKETVNSLDIDVTSNDVIDKYATKRTCVNYPERALIECNLERILELQNNKKLDIIVGTIFHEILGLMSIELGHQENVSQYPISSKIIPYTTMVLNMQIHETNILPMYSGLDFRSYGVTFINKKTKESIRMICINENMPINRCKNFSIVTQFNDLQSPLVDHKAIISKDSLKKISIEKIKPEIITKLEKKIETINQKGFKFLTLRGSINATNDNEYRYGTGLLNQIHDLIGYSDTGFALLIVPVPSYPIFAAFDTAVEGGKQLLNIGIFPVKFLVNLSRKGILKARIKNMNKNINRFEDLINYHEKISLFDRKKTLNDKSFEELRYFVRQIISNSK